MIHLRIVAPPDRAERTLELLRRVDSACNLIHMAGAAERPDGDVILVDVAREDASVIVSDLRELRIPEEGSIAIEEIDTSISAVAERAEKAAKGAPSDSVVWEEVEARTSESAALSGSFLAFMVLATLIATVGLLQDSPILIVGAMVVGPEFGPIAGICVAVVEKRRRLAVRSATALAIGFPLAMAGALVFTLVIKALGLPGDDFAFDSRHQMAEIVSDPSVFTVIVAACAGTAGVLSLTTAKSAALIGVLISVTTIPAAAGVAVAAAYGDTDAWLGSQLQLAVNIAAILTAGALTLLVQRLVYRRRRVEHLSDDARAAAGLPVGESRHRRGHG